MASHFVGLARGLEGSQYSDYTTGTATNAGSVFEFRLDDSFNPRPAEILKALKAFERFFENVQLWNPAGFIING